LPLATKYALLLGCSSDAEDIAQDVVLEFLSKPVRYDPARRFRSLLKRRVHSRKVDHFRMHERDAVPVSDEVLNGIAWRTEFEEDFRVEWLRVTFDIIRGEFEPRTWQAFKRCKLEEQSSNEVAAELGMIPNAIHQACFRVMERLRKEMTPLCDKKKSSGCV